MRFCFIIEEQYRRERMPLAVADELRQWGHDVELLEPHGAITSLSQFTRHGYDAFDAYILKTVSGGPGLSILEAAEALGIATINKARSIRLVRDKAVAAACARAYGLPFPHTYLVAHPRLLAQIPAEDYPLVVKPSNGSSCRDIYRVNSPAELPQLELAVSGHSCLLAQRYVENAGYDIKLYVIGSDVYAVARRSPLQHDVQVAEQLMPVTPDLRALALGVGRSFGLDIYGVDVVETAQGWVGLDINDFPSFGLVPHAVARIAESILHLAKRAGMRRIASASLPLIPLFHAGARPRITSLARVRPRLQSALQAVSTTFISEHPPIESSPPWTSAS